MVHHPCDILLGQIVKAGTFGKHTADKLMVDFDLMRFQMGFLRVVESFQQGAFVDGRAGIAQIKTCDKLRQSIRQSVITRVIFFLQNAVSSLDIISL